MKAFLLGMLVFVVLFLVFRFMNESNIFLVESIPAFIAAHMLANRIVPDRNWIE